MQSPHRLFLILPLAFFFSESYALGMNAMAEPVPQGVGTRAREVVSARISPYVEQFQEQFGGQRHAVETGSKRDERVGRLVANIAQRAPSILVHAGRDGSSLAEADAQLVAQYELARFMSIPAGETDFSQGVTMEAVVQKIHDVAAALMRNSGEGALTKEARANLIRHTHDDGSINPNGLTPEFLTALGKTLRQLEATHRSHDEAGRQLSIIKDASRASLLHQVGRALGHGARTARTHQSHPLANVAAGVNAAVKQFKGKA